MFCYQKQKNQSTERVWDSKRPLNLGPLNLEFLKLGALNLGPYWQFLDMSMAKSSPDEFRCIEQRNLDAYGTMYIIL